MIKTPGSRSRKHEMIAANSTIGPYTLIRKLGQGGFGEVWLAERRGELVTTNVAIKLPFENLTDLELIRREAEIWELASGHANVLPIIEADVFDGQIAIVSEFASEGSLQKKLSDEGRISIPTALDLTIAVLNGLAYLHSKGIVHRDLKPANIMLQAGSPRLTDFGISKLIDSQSGSQTTNVSGTFPYMAPEAFDGKQSFQTDIWSAGILLYQLTTGKMPFPQKEMAALVRAIVMEDFDPLPAGFPPGIGEVITTALSKATGFRFKSANEMRDQLIRVQNGSWSSDNLDSWRSAVPPDDTDTITVVRPSKRAATRNTIRWVALSIVVIVSSGLGWIGYSSRQQGVSNRIQFVSPVNQPAPLPLANRTYLRGPRGGCYYLNEKAKKVYVDREMCD